MSDGSEFDGADAEQSAQAPNPAVFPAFSLPRRVGEVGGAVALAAAALTMTASAIQALTYRESRPLSVGGQLGAPFRQPHVGFATRLAIFAAGGAALGVALLLIVAILITAMSRDPAEPDDALGERRRVMLLTGAALAAVIAVADLAMCFEIVRNANFGAGAFIRANRAASVIQFLSPALVAVGVIWYAVSRVRAVGRGGFEPP